MPRRAPDPVVIVHRDEIPPPVEALHAAPPFVAAETGGGAILLLNGAQVEACGSDPDALIVAIETAAADADLTWPEPVN